MRTYVINLKTLTDRRQYMDRLLSKYTKLLDVNFIEAVDGRNFSDEQLGLAWNQALTYKIYGRDMKKGEIGCALSHRKCYEEISRNNDKVALILEDDVAFKEDANLEELIPSLEKVLHTKKPTVILLTGSYWFTRKKSIFDSNVRLASVFEAMGTVAYMLNQSAATLMMTADKKFLADDWYNWRSIGVTVYAVYPYVAGDIGLFGSVIAADYEGWKRKNLSLVKQLHVCYRAVVRRYLGKIGNFERRK